METPSLAISFISGMLLFFSPCIAPVIPAYLASISGVRWSELQDQKSIRWDMMANAFAFVIGFSLIFVALGSTLGYLSSLMVGLQVWINRVGGMLIIVLALHMLELINIPFLSREFNVSGKVQRKGYVGSALMGSAFGLAWTPCTGPILAAILALSATSGSFVQGAWLMTAFSAGLAIPFLLAGAFTAGVSEWLSSHRGFIAGANRAAGVLLIVLGVFIFTGRVQTLLGAMFNFFDLSF